MHNDKVIQIITEKRSDALHIHVQSLIAGLRKAKVRVKVIQSNNRRFKYALLNFILEMFNTLRTVLLVDRSATLLFADPLSFNLLAARFLNNKKYVLFFHYERDPFFYKFIPFVSYRDILDRFDGVICSSNFSVSQLRLLGSKTKKYRVIYCGIDHDLFRPSKSKLYPFEYILSVGSEEPRKNMQNILTAFAQLRKDFPNLKLLKVGRASIKNRQNTMNWIKRLQLAKAIDFIDYVDKEKLPEIYSGARLLLFPSLLEGFGLPVAEAMACGCPVVTSNRDPMQEIVGEGYDTVNPLDPDEIAKNCQKILVDNDYRKTVIINGLIRAKEFDWNQTASKTYEYIAGDL